MVATSWNAKIVNIIGRKNALRMTRTMNRKLCPIWAASAAIEKSEGPRECIEDLCQMWCLEEYKVGSDRYLAYRAGCGLMPKENRKV